MATAAPLPMSVASILQHVGLAPFIEEFEHNQVLLDDV